MAVDVIGCVFWVVYAVLPLLVYVDWLWLSLLDVYVPFVSVIVVCRVVVNGIECVIVVFVVLGLLVGCVFAGGMCVLCCVDGFFGWQCFFVRVRRVCACACFLLDVVVGVWSVCVVFGVCGLLVGCVLGVGSVFVFVFLGNDVCWIVCVVCVCCVFVVFVGCCVCWCVLCV